MCFDLRNENIFFLKNPYVQMAVDLKLPTVAYPVHSLINFNTGEPGSCFSECHLLKAGTTVAQLGSMLFDGEDSYR